MKGVFKMEKNVKMIEYLAGEPNKLANQITETIGPIIASGGNTLKDIGYIGSMITAKPDTGEVSVDLYFSPELAFIEEKNEFNDKKVLRLRAALENLENYAFVGSILKVVSIETKSFIPIHRIRNSQIEFAYNDLKRQTIRKKNKHTDTVLVVHGNPMILMAAVHNINLFDPNYRVDFEMDAMSGFRKAGDDNFYPVTIRVYQSTDSRDPYRPDEAIPYLKQLVKKNKERHERQNESGSKIQKKFKKEFKENPELREADKNISFSAFSKKG